MQQEHYEVIARKWRPQGFDDLIGQQHITATLKNELQSGRLAHAFLFSGIRGVGKTSAARILAKALNCQQTDKPTTTPCNQCEACVSIKNGTSTDVLEIDGASNRKIEHIRELRENIKFAPAKFRYKVYIIDEVHMLTKEAFNALLKTLEEPPKHAIFILATTDTHKVPITITSRCQRFLFRRIGYSELAQALRRITDAEGVTIDEQSLLYIAKRSEGSVRDSQSLLEQVISYCGNTVTQDKVSELLGLIGSDSLLAMLTAIFQQQPDKVLEVIYALTLQGHDLEQFYQELLEHLRHLLVLKVAPNAQYLLENSVLSADVLARQIEGQSLQHVQQVFKYLLRMEAFIKQGTSPRFTLEMVLLQATQLASFEAFDASLQTIQTLGEKFAMFKRLHAQRSSVVALPQPQPVVPAQNLVDKTDETARLQQALEIFRGTLLQQLADVSC